MIKIVNYLEFFTESLRISFAQKIIHEPFSFDFVRSTYIRIYSRLFEDLLALSLEVYMFKQTKYKKDAPA